MSEMCYRAGNALLAEFSSDELAVVTELYGRITIHSTKDGRRPRTENETKYCEVLVENTGVSPMVVAEGTPRYSECFRA